VFLRRATPLVLLAFVVGSCSASRPNDDAEVEPTRRRTAPPSSTVLVAQPIPQLALRPLAPVPGEWTGIRSDGTRVYAFRELGTGIATLGRFDPATGALLASRDLPKWSSYTVTAHGVVVLRVDERRLLVLDLEDLSDLRSIALPDGRPDLNADLPHGDPFWIGSRQTREGAIAGRPARMALVRIDLASGVIAEIRDVTECGAKSAAQLDDRRVAFVIECTYQPAVLDLETGHETTFDGFPDAAHTFAVAGTAWFRWKALGYLARLHDGGVESLDLNADGPVIANLNASVTAEKSVWIVGEAATGTSNVLYRVDPEDFRVTGRASLPTDGVAFVNGRGLTATTGGLQSFDPSTVMSAVPRQVVRPTLGVPPAVETDDPDELAAIEVFSTTFDPSVPTVSVVAKLEDPTLAPLRDELARFANSVYPGVVPRVTAVSVDGESASLTYVLPRDGKLAFVPVSATLRRVASGWVVTRDSLCELAQLAGVSDC